MWRQSVSHGSTGPPGIGPEKWHSARVKKRAGPDLEVAGVLRVILGARNLILWTFYLPTFSQVLWQPPFPETGDMRLGSLHSPS